MVPTPTFVQSARASTHSRTSPPTTSSPASESIRPATEGDEPALRRLYDAFQKEVGGPAFLRERWEDAWADLRRHVADGLGFSAPLGALGAALVFAAAVQLLRRSTRTADCL